MTPYYILCIYTVPIVCMDWYCSMCQPVLQYTKIAYLNCRLPSNNIIFHLHPQCTLRRTPEHSQVHHWLTPTQSPAFPPFLVNPRLICPIAIPSQHHCPITSPCAYLPFIINLTPQPSYHPSLQSPHVQASRPCTDVQGLVACGISKVSCLLKNS